MGTQYGHIPSPVSRTATADQSAKQFRFVDRASASTAALATDTDAPLGVLQNYPSSGESCNIAAAGRAKCKLGEAVAVAPAYLCPDDSSTGKKCTLAGQRFGFIAHEEGASGQIVDGIAATGFYGDATDCKAVSAADGVITLTTTQCLYGVVELTGAVGAVTFPTAANLIADCGLTQNGQHVRAHLWNSSANNKTLTTNTGVTLFKNEAASDAVMATTEHAIVTFIRTSATTVDAIINKFVAV